MIRFIFQAFFIIYSIYSLNAQDQPISITGKLLDSKSKEPLPFTSIYIKGTSIGTTSNIEGYFIFHIPYGMKDNPIIISMIGYKSVQKPVKEFKKKEIIYLQESSLELKEVVISTEKPLTAKQIVSKAFKSIDKNYPSEPYILEGFIRDLQNEDSVYVEYLECATKLFYHGKKEPRIDLVALRQSYIADKNKWNEQWDRKNSIIDLVEDDFIRYKYGPIKIGNGWKYEMVSVLPFGDKIVYKIKATNKPFSSALLYIDTDSFAFVRIELTRSTHNGRYYKRRLSNGQQESHYNIVFEYQEYKGKWYLKYQKEEDVWKIFKGLESRKLLFTKYPKKELFVNKIITEAVDQYPFENNLNRNKSIESQAKPYDPDFWKYYNSPAQTKELSRIEAYLKKAEIELKK